MTSKSSDTTEKTTGLSSKKVDWFLYIVKCHNGHLYTGITTNVKRRFAEHQTGGAKGAKYLKGKGPLTLVYQENAVDRSAATKRELAVKKLTRSKKLALIASYQHEQYDECHL